MMSKYFKHLNGVSKISRNSSNRSNFPDNFELLSSRIISNCSLAQDHIQRIIYTTHGPDLLDAKRALKKFPNPKARFEFLCSFSYVNPDPVVLRAFNHARDLFKEIYELRNVLAHEVWYYDGNYPDTVSFSTLDDNARLLMTTGCIWHVEDATPQDTFNETMRYIENVKLVTTNQLLVAIGDLDLCVWSLMQIDMILNQENLEKKEELRRSFFVYKGISHLFPDSEASAEAVVYSSSKSKSIF